MFARAAREGTKDGPSSKYAILYAPNIYQGLFSQSIRGAETGHFGLISENSDPF